MSGGRNKFGAALLLIGALLAAVALLAGCGGDSDAGAEATPTETLPKNQTGAVLEPVNGGQASGTALLLPRTPKRPAHFKVMVEGLKPNTNGGQYVVWLTTSRHDMVPLYSYPVGKSGIFNHEWMPNPLHVGFIERGEKTKFLVTLAKNDAEHEQTLEGGETAYDPPFIGAPIVEGPITGPRSGSTASE